MRSLQSRAIAGMTAAFLVGGSLIAPSGAAAATSIIPNPPTDVAVAPDETTEGPVVLTWTAPTNEEIASYQIFRYAGAGTATADHYTFLTTIAGDEEAFLDELPSEGIFQYALIAVDKDGQPSKSSAWVTITMDDGEGDITPDRTAPTIPTGLSLGGEYANRHQVTLSWTEQETADLWRFLLYRADHGGSRQFLGYISGEDTQLTDQVTADGSYAYYLMAQDTTGNLSSLSAGKRVLVDTIAPAVTITSPEQGRSYTGTGKLPVTLKVVEDGAGYEASEVSYYLNGVTLSAKEIDLATLKVGTHRLKAVVTDRAGNIGEQEILFGVKSAVTAPDAPQDVNLPQYSKSRSITLTWSAPQATGVAGYDIYRAKAGATEAKVGSTTARVLTYSETVAADGLYTYTVVARYSDGTQVAAAPVATTVDTVAPTITITAPKSTTYRAADKSITIDVNVTDATSGVAASGIKYFLNGKAHTTSKIDLTTLDGGEHLFKVEATDRAGNKAVKSVTFRLEATDDGDEDDNDKPVQGNHLIAALAKQKSEISAGHYAALSAFAKNGNTKQFRKHVEKFGGTKFISEKAAKELLKALGDANSTPGKGKGQENNPGKGNGNGNKPKK